ncbi:MAG: response regulator transcription factor [Acidobacteria bacterium]|nr:response regulator transcription factor [Acidobacteriota bacterium]
MQERIRVAIAADSIEDMRKLEEIFAPSAGFLVTGGKRNGVEQPAKSDVLVIRSDHARQRYGQTKVPVLYLGGREEQGREDNEFSAVLSIDASPAQIRAAAAALAVGLRLGDQRARSHSEGSDFSFLEPLTERELEVLNLIAEGLSNPQIARQLTVSRNTVKFHVSSIIAKLGASSRTEAVTIALRHGLIII